MKRCFYLLMSSNKAKDMTVKYTDIEVDRISASEFQEMNVLKVQQIAYVRYDHKVLGHDQALLIQLPKIHLETYGVPRAGEYYKNDSDRSFVKVPLNESDPDILVFVNKLKEIDAYLSSPKFASKLLGKKWQKYTYVPAYRPSTITQDDDDDDNKKKSTKKPALNYAYMKLKLDTEYGLGKIKTQVYRPEIINNKRERVEVSDIESVDDFARILCYQCKFLAIIRGAKIWAQPPSKNNPMWGVTFKMIKVEVEPPVKNTSTFYKDYMNSDAFLDSDEENNIPNKQAVQVDSDDSDEEEPKSVKKISTKKVAQVDSDDSDEEEPKPVVKKTPDKKVNKVESDDSDEEEPKPVVKKTPDKKVVPVESDDSDEEEPKPVKKPSSKKIIHVESDSDNDKPPPIKKPVSKTTGARGGKSKSTNA